jgi:hypothetical protein
MNPQIFIASSVEGRPIAEALQANLEYNARCTVWDQAFTLSVSTIDRLLLYCVENDFAIFVFSKDDVALIREKQYPVARDNVVFEAGLFMGMHGKDSAFVVVPRDTPQLHIPTDLLGWTMANYDADRAKIESRAALGFATTEIKKAIELSSWTNLRPSIAHKGTAGGKTYPLKMRFETTNNHRDPVAIESLGFDLSDNLKLDPNARKSGVGNRYRPQFLVWRTVNADGSKTDHYEDRCIIEPGKSFISWVPIAPSIGKATLENAVKNRTAGVWHYRCCWFRQAVITYNYSEELPRFDPDAETLKEATLQTVSNGTRLTSPLFDTEAETLTKVVPKKPEMSPQDIIMEIADHLRKIISPGEQTLVRFEPLMGLGLTVTQISEHFEAAAEKADCQVTDKTDTRATVRRGHARLVRS